MKTPDYIEVEDATSYEINTFWVRIKNRNGQVLFTSETYDSRSNARIEVRETK
jgi:uncharacterized protein YegP (UPF0339 family)